MTNYYISWCQKLLRSQVQTDVEGLNIQSKTSTCTNWDKNKSKGLRH